MNTEERNITGSQHRKQKKNPGKNGGTEKFMTEQCRGSGQTEQGHTTSQERRVEQEELVREGKQAIKERRGEDWTTQRQDRRGKTTATTDGMDGEN